MGAGGSVFLWVKLFFKPGCGCPFHGELHGQWGHRGPHARPGHPALDQVSDQQRGKSPSTERVLRGRQGTADPARPRARLHFNSFQKRRWIVVLSLCPLLQLSQLSHPYGEGGMCNPCSPQGWRLERRLPVAVPGWGTPLPPFLREPRHIGHPHSSPAREESGPGAPQRETLGPCEFVRPAQARGQGLGQRLV